MEPIKKAWGFRLSENVKQSVKYRAGKAFVWFLAFMLSATLLSRAADGRTIAVVETEQPKRSAIAQTIETDGLLEISGGSPVKIPAGVYVEEVFAENGQAVTAGDLLFTYDIDDYKKQITALQLDIKRIGAEQAVEKEDALWQQEEELSKQETALERKEEDKTSLEADFDIRSRDLQQKIRAAYLALGKYDSIHRDQYDGEEFTLNEYEALRSAHRSLLFQQEELENEREKLLQDVVRSIEDLSAQPEKKEKSAQLGELEKQKINLELSSLYRAVESGGAVYAPSDGIVTDLKIETGGNSVGGTALFLSQKSGLKGIGILTKEQKKFISVGDVLIFTPYGERQGKKGPLVASIEPSAQNPEEYSMTVEVDDLDLPAGTGGTFGFQKKSVAHETCVPLSALYSEGEQVYVLVLEESETALGREKHARRVDVVVQDKNERIAAVTGALSANDQVIVSSDKAVSQGSRIRLEAVT